MGIIGLKPLGYYLGVARTSSTLSWSNRGRADYRAFILLAGTIMDDKKREGGMTNRFWLCLLFAMLGTAGLGAQTNDTKPIPRTSDGKPDFSGFFNLQYTPNMAMGKEDLVPYTPAGKAAYLNHDAKDDPGR